MAREHMVSYKHPVLTDCKNYAVRVISVSARQSCSWTALAAGAGARVNPPKKQNEFRWFSCWRGRRIDVEAQGGGATLEGGDAPLALLFLALLSLVDEVFTAGQHEIHHACELVRRGGVGAGLVHAAAQAAIECAERGVAV